MEAVFAAAFEDFNYEEWAKACGCTFRKLEPQEGGGFELHLTGTPSAIATFASDYGEKPIR